MTRTFDALVCDLDGVLYRGDVPVPGAADAVARLRGEGVRILYCTNNSRWTFSEYLARLRGYGLDVADDELLTSAVVTAEHAAARGFAGRPAFVVGGSGIRESLSRVGVELLDADAPEGPADLVVVGWDPDFTYFRMRRAASLARDGAELWATNDDVTFPAPGGDQWPGAGALLAAIEAASGRRAEVMGKPYPPMAEAAAARLPEGARVAVVGDRVESDLALADVHGWSKVLVLSGVTDAAAAARLDPQPDLVLRSIADLT